jgi:hypothetical protein
VETVAGSVVGSGAATAEATAGGSTRPSTATHRGRSPAN